MTEQEQRIANLLIELFPFVQDYQAVDKEGMVHSYMWLDDGFWHWPQGLFYNEQLDEDGDVEDAIEVLEDDHPFLLFHYDDDKHKDKDDLRIIIDNDDDDYEAENVIAFPTTKLRVFPADADLNEIERLLTLGLDRRDYLLTPKR